MRKITVILLLSIMLAACSGSDEIDPNLTEAELYQKASGNMNQGKYDKSVEYFQALEARYPFGSYSDQAQLDIIYAYYMGGEAEAAGAAADRFIRLHPQHPQVDYAYYIRGLSSFTESQGVLERFMPTDMTRRDPGAARKSFAEFSDLLTRFPNSEYAPDARKRMIYLRNLLARYEIHTANYLFKRGAWLAAANRGRYVVENFQESPAVPDGLAVMVQGYHSLGLDDLSEQALVILKANYPTYPYLDKDGNFEYQDDLENEKRDWLNIATAGLLGHSEPAGFDTRKLYAKEAKDYEGSE
ncbi:MAG TPA: outer membrane protein assembly factor BamD [Pseudomonadales bacterium]|nr:outer membrane protein assembly factor BamD [Pseudomonadales bacterium]